MWQHNYEPIGGSLMLSAVVAAIPILVLFFMLGVLRKPAWMSAAAALVSAVVVALFGYGMPVQMAIMSTLMGAAYGVFPIAWIVFSSIMLYRFPDSFYKTQPSPCAPLGTPNVLSSGDRAGLQHLYPSDPAAAQVVEMQLAKLQALVEPFDEGLESEGALADDAELPEHLLAALAVYERKGTGG